jgi:hypothetical protein
MVEVRVGDDQVADRRASRQAEIGEGIADPMLAGAGVDRDYPVACRYERKIGEVVSLGHVDVGLGAEDLRRGEAEAVVAVHPPAAH